MSSGHLLCADRSEAETQNHITKYNTKYIGYGELIEMPSIFFSRERTDRLLLVIKLGQAFPDTIFDNHLLLKCEKASDFFMA
jgi:hypothetical protein